MTGVDLNSFLLFEAKLISEDPADSVRFFALHYYLSDKAVAIFEKKDSRKGIQGGRFLVRMKLTDPKTGKEYGDDSFYIGARITAAGRVFELVDAPDHTYTQLEANAQRFPIADLQYAVDALSSGVGKAAVEAAFKAKVADKTGKVSVDDAKEVLLGFIPKIRKETAIMILRRFAQGADFDYEELVGYLA
jgi:hypothetical protein